MMTRILTFAVLLALLASCGNQAKKADDAIKASEVTVNELLADAGPFVEQAVSVKGTVVHVCRHGGQRLFIVGEDTEERMRCTTGEDIAEFSVDLEGSQVEITGIVKELIIDETYLAEWETEVMEGTTEHERGEGHEGGVGHVHAEGEEHAHGEAEDHAEGEEHAHGEAEDHAHGEAGEAEHAEGEDAEAALQSTLDQIQSLRDEIAVSGKDHLSDYWIETVSFKVKEGTDSDADMDEDTEAEAEEEEKAE